MPFVAAPQLQMVEKGINFGTGEPWAIEALFMHVFTQSKCVHTVYRETSWYKIRIESVEIARLW